MFFDLFTRLLPLYLIIFIGFCAGRWIRTDRDTIARLLMFMIAPFIIFNGAFNVQLDWSTASLPLLVFVIGCTVCFLVYQISSLLIKDNRRNIIAFSSASSNTGYFGLPIAMMLFDLQTVSLYIVAFLGVTLFENTFGFYVAARGFYTTKDCLIRIIKLPSVHAMILGFICNYLGKKAHFVMPDPLIEFLQNMRSTYSILGMMVVGLGLSQIKKFTLDWDGLIISIISKYLLWPLLMLGAIMIDKHYLHFYESHVHKALIVLSVVPISITTVLVASMLNFNSEKASILVLINTLVGLFYVPFMLDILFTII